MVRLKVTVLKTASLNVCRIRENFACLRLVLGHHLSAAAVISRSY